MRRSIHATTLSAVLLCATSGAGIPQTTKTRGETRTQDVVFRSVDVELSGTVAVPSKPLAGIVWTLESTDGVCGISAITLESLSRSGVPV